MEILAILVLGVSLIFSFSRDDYEPKFTANNSSEQDPDWAFMELSDFDVNCHEK
jgi:hypothetical protein